MLHSVTNGAMQGAIIGGVTGLLLWLMIKIFGLEGYFGGKKTPPTSPITPATPTCTMSPQEANASNAWSGDSAYPPPPVLGDVAPAPAPTQTALIAVMWGLTAMGFIATVFLHITSVLLIFLDLPAIVIAIILLCKRNAVNRWNGGAKLGMELIAFVIVFIATIRVFPGLSTPEPMPAIPMASPVVPPIPGRIAPPPNFAPPPFARPNFPAPPQFSGPPMPNLLR